MSKGTRYCLLLGVLIVVLFALNLIMGSVSIPLKDVANIIFNGVTERESWRFIILGSRLPQALTALLCGAALAIRRPLCAGEIRICPEGVQFP